MSPPSRRAEEAQQEEPIRTGNGFVDAAASFGGKVINSSPQGMNNLVLIILAVAFGLLIYVDRRDRMEHNGMQLRTFESQGELNRQSISNNTTAISSLTMTVGKLDTAVTELRREVSGKKIP